MASPTTNQTDINHFHLFIGLRDGADGFQDTRPEILGMQGRMVCIGGMDLDPTVAEDLLAVPASPPNWPRRWPCAQASRHEGVRLSQ